jgi:hypothetical protein
MKNGLLLSAAIVALVLLNGCSKQDQSLPGKASGDMAIIERVTTIGGSMLKATQAAAPSSAPVESAIHTLLQTASYVPEKELVVLHFHVSRTSNIKIAISVDRQVPIDMIVLRGTVIESHYDDILMSITEHDVQELGKALGAARSPEEPPKTYWSTAKLFANPLSKEGVYGQYESDWVSVAPANYTIILDNEGHFTPPRGDAPVQIAVYMSE